MIQCSCGLQFKSLKDWEDHKNHWKKMGDPFWMHIIDNSTTVVKVE